MDKLGIMQGRLVPPENGRFQSFPRARWRDEFPLASACGLDTIEWIYDGYGENVNPIATEDGIAELRGLVTRCGVTIESICADWFMDFPLAVAQSSVAATRWHRLEWLMERARLLDIKRIVLPFVDASAITTADQMSDVVRGLTSMSKSIERTQVELHLETSLDPSDFAALLARVSHPGIKVNYDSGNSASLGFSPSDEFQAYGTRVGSVHLKDRQRGAGTVPLGAGDANFDELFGSLAAVAYVGDFVLQVARGAADDEFEWVRKNVDTGRRMIQKLTRTRLKSGTKL